MKLKPLLVLGALMIGTPAMAHSKKFDPIGDSNKHPWSVPQFGERAHKKHHHHKHHYHYVPKHRHYHCHIGEGICHKHRHRVYGNHHRRHVHYEHHHAPIEFHFEFK